MNPMRRMNGILRGTILSAAATLILWTPAMAETVNGSREAANSAAPATVESSADGRSGDRGSDYRIGRQDLLDIRVFELDELSQTVRVSGDGFVTLPLLGRLQAAGLTKTELEQKIAEGLGGRYVLEPQVTVFVKEFESTKVAISGAVKQPGRYPMLEPMTLLAMISQAGGLREDHGGQIVVSRELPDGTTQRSIVDLRRLVRADPAANIKLEPRDVVYVEEQKRMRIFVSGAVNNPDMFEIRSGSPLTMMQAVTLAGGTTPRAAEKKVHIIRTDAAGQRKTLRVNLRKVKRGKAEDPILRAGDLVFVQQSFF